jgi:hypothetical protein
MNRRWSFYFGLFCTEHMLAQSKPDFSGVWKLNTPESNFSDKRLAAPDRLVWTIRLANNHIIYNVDREWQGKTNKFDAEADVGGGSFESDAAGIIRWQWKGSSLSVTTLYNPGNDREASMEEIWTLLADGKKLTDEVVYHMPKKAKDPSDVHFTRVFDKQ